MYTNYVIIRSYSYHLQFQDTIVVKLAGNVWVQIVNGVIVAEWSDYVAGYVDISQNVLHLFNCNGGDIFVPLFESPPAMSGHANQQLALDLLHTQISALNSQLLLLDTKRRESAEKMYNSENPLQIISDSLTEKALAIPKSFQVKWIAAEFIAPFLLSIHCSIRNTSRCAFTSFTIIPLIESHESCTSKSFPGKIDPASTAKLECIIECNEMLGLVEVLCTWQTESGCFTRIVVCDTLIIANNSALARSCFFFSKRIMFPATGIIWEEIVKQMGFNHASKFHCTRNNTNSSIQLIHFNDHIVVLVSDSSRKMLLWNCEILRKLIAQEAGTTTSDAKIYPEIVDGTPAPSGLYLCVVALNKSKLDILNGLSRLFNRY